MATVETRVTVFATPVQTSAARRADGVQADQETYGLVNVVHRTRTTRVSVRGAVLGEPVVHDKVMIANLDPGDVAHLIKTLASALAISLDVRDTGLRRDIE